KDGEKTDDDRLAHFKKTFNAIADVAQSVFSTIDGFAGASTEKEKNRIQKLIDANNKYSEAETERINNSTLSEQDKAAKLIQLKARNDGKNQELERRQKEQDIKKAKFDKAAAIASIIFNTAKAIVSALPDVALSIIAGVTGAAELAVAIATPIPT